MIALDAIGAGSVRRYFGGAPAMVASCSKLQWVSAAERPDVSCSTRASDVDRLGPELAGFDGALLDAAASCASRRVERRDAVVPFIGWARRPFPMRGVRGNSGHTCPVHVRFLSACPVGDEVETAPRRATWRGGQDGHRGDDYKIGTERGVVKGRLTAAAVNNVVNSAFTSSTNVPIQPLWLMIAPAAIGCKRWLGLIKRSKDRSQNRIESRPCCTVEGRWVNPTTHRLLVESLEQACLVSNLTLVTR